MSTDNLKSLLSDIEMNDQILGKEKKYFNSAVLLPVIKLDGQNHLLFQQRAQGIKQENEICFPGGKYDLDIDQNYQQTAVRETIEELGVKREEINILAKLGTIVAPIGATIDAYVGELKISSLSELQLNYEEVAEVFAIPLSYFKDYTPQHYQVRVEIQPHYFNSDGEKVTLLPVNELSLPFKYSTPWVGDKHSIYVYHTKHGVIWGITAELIVELLERLD